MENILTKEVIIPTKIKSQISHLYLIWNALGIIKKLYINITTPQESTAHRIAKEKTSKKAIISNKRVIT